MIGLLSLLSTVFPSCVCSAPTSRCICLFRAVGPDVKSEPKQGLHTSFPPVPVHRHRRQSCIVRTGSAAAATTAITATTTASAVAATVDAAAVAAGAAAPLTHI